jgi:hypothetical protein
LVMVRKQENVETTLIPGRLKYRARRWTSNERKR